MNPRVHLQLFGLGSAKEFDEVLWATKSSLCSVVAIVLVNGLVAFGETDRLHVLIHLTFCVLLFALVSSASNHRPPLIAHNASRFSHSPPLTAPHR